MQVTPTELPGLVVITPRVHGDERGYFFETYRASLYKEQGITEDFCQDNFSSSKKGILRGLHFQNPSAQGKLVQVLRGEVYDVAVDLRLSSPTFGRHFAIILSSANHLQVYVPPGFAHGFCTLSNEADFLYKCTAPYHQEAEGTIQWNDPDLKIPWPCAQPLISAKDAQGMSFAAYQKSAKVFM